MRSESSIRLICPTRLTKLSQAARHGLVIARRTFLRRQGVLLSLPMGGKLRSTGCPERRKSGGYGAFVLVVFISTKGSRSLRNLRYPDASDWETLGFKISRDSKITNILAKVSSIDNLIAAYDAIKSKPGNITPGIRSETLDGITKGKLELLSSELIRGRFKFKPSRRVIIPKKSGGERPLSIPSPIDKVVHQAMKQQLDLLFNPIFYDCSHGFRPERGCHTAFNQIKITFGGINWVIEGDIRDCFEDIKFDVLYPLIARFVADQGFEILVRKFYRAGFMVNGYRQVTGGLLQGRPVRPVFINIVLHELDKFILGIKEEVDLLYRRPRQNPEYTKLIRRDSNKTSVQVLEDRKTIIKNRIPSRIYSLHNTRLRYIRYADDFIVGIAGSKDYVVRVKIRIAEFLINELGLKINIEKTKVTNLISDRVLFLGAWIHRTPRRKLPFKGGKILTPRVLISAPVTTLIKKLIGDGIGVQTRRGG